MRNMTEEQKILKALNDEPTLARWTVVRSMIGLAIVVGLLFIGLYTDDRAAREAELASLGARVSLENASALHRRQIFEARRARHEGAGRGTERMQHDARAQ